MIKLMPVVATLSVLLLAAPMAQAEDETYSSGATVTSPADEDSDATTNESVEGSGMTTDAAEATDATEPKPHAKPQPVPPATEDEEEE